MHVGRQMERWEPDGTMWGAPNITVSWFGDEPGGLVRRLAGLVEYKRCCIDFRSMVIFKTDKKRQEIKVEK